MQSPQLLVLSVLLPVFALLPGCGQTTSPRTAVSPGGANDASLPAPDFGLSGTFSIAAVDPETGICGVAVASMYPAVGAAVPYVRANAGAFCTQHYHDPEFGPRALEALAAGEQPNEILADLLRNDPRAEQRQLAIVDRLGRSAQHNPSRAPESSRWWGAVSGRNYACQGNTLCGSHVLTAMANAFESTRATLADRLMAALVAGDCAGGDHRGRLAAAIVVAKPEVEGMWLDERVDKSEDAVLDLARRYVDARHDATGVWAEQHRPWQHPCADRPEPRAPQQ